MLWHLADRIGEETASGVTVAVDLTHERLGHLIGARRPTVSLALRSLAERGQVTRGDCGWVLDSDSRRVIGRRSKTTIHMG